MAIDYTFVVEEDSKTDEVSFDGKRHSQIKEYYVREQSGKSFKPPDLFKVHTHVGPPFPEIGAAWPAIRARGDTAFGQRILHTPQATVVPGHLLTCKRVTISKLEPSLAKMTAIYSDDTDLWLTKRSVEIGTEGSTQYIDQDALDGDLGGFWNGVLGCYDWAGLSQSVFSQGLGDAFINGSEGVNTSVPKVIVTLRGLWYDMFTVLRDAGRDAGTINRFDMAAYGFPGRDQWMFLGANANELKKNQAQVGGGADVWEITWKFKFDPFGHRTFAPVFEFGNLFDLPNTGSQQQAFPCKSSRAHLRADWDWLSSVTFL